MKVIILTVLGIGELYALYNFILFTESLDTDFRLRKLKTNIRFLKRNLKGIG